MKINYKILISISFLSVLYSCNTTEQTAENHSDTATLEKVTDISIEQTNALTLLKTNCFICHNPNLETDNRVAPPLFKIQEHYIDDETSKEEFVNNIVNFINNPTEDNSIMPGAVRNFGLMPKLSYKNEDLVTIASYLFDNDVSTDEWYELWESYKNNEQLTQSINYEDLGRNFANITKATLGKNLMKAIKEKGSAGAIEFCNTKAIPITDSMSNIVNASVKRVSDQPRNPNNLASEDELYIINQWKNNLSNNEKITPVVVEKNNFMIGYYPIETNAMCLQCHGEPQKHISNETITKLKNLYPNDLAIGYKENQLRGIFVVQMNK